MPATMTRTAASQVEGCRVRSRELVRVRTVEHQVCSGLDQAIRDAREQGATLDALSEATGYTPKAIRRICGES